jgi:hypothetical protein
MASWYFTSTLLVAAVAFIVFRLRDVGRRPKGFPPGPPTLPIIGNLHQIPAKKQYLQLQKWAQIYGPVYSLILGTQVMIVLSSDVAVKDLLDKRSAIYSSRPEMYIGNQVASGGLRMVLMVSLVPLHLVLHTATYEIPGVLTVAYDSTLTKYLTY